MRSSNALLWALGLGGFGVVAVAAAASKAKGSLEDAKKTEAAAKKQLDIAIANLEAWKGREKEFSATQEKYAAWTKNLELSQQEVLDMHKIHDAAAMRVNKLTGLTK